MLQKILVTLVSISFSAAVVGCIEDNPDFMGVSSSQASDTSGTNDGTSAESGGVDGTGTSGTSGTSGGDTTGGSGGMTGDTGTGNPGTAGDTAGATATGTDTSTTGLMCDAGLTDCDGGCVDVQTTKNHCGECFNKCTGSDNCEMGMCVPK